MGCVMCKGTLETRKRAHMVELDHCIVIVKNVPTHVCTQCGEKYYTNPVAMELERLVKDATAHVLTEVAIIHFSREVA